MRVLFTGYQSKLDARNFASILGKGNRTRFFFNSGSIT